MTSSTESTSPNSEPAVDPAREAAKKRFKVVAVTFGVVLALWGALFFLTENESTAPFVYAIF